MVTKKRAIVCALACVGATTAFTLMGSRASADDARLTVRPAVVRTVESSDHGPTIQLVRHGYGGYHGGYGYRGGYYGGYGYRPIVRPYVGIGYGYPVYNYGYPAYGYYGGGYGYPGYGYGGCGYGYGGGVGVGIW